MGKRITNNDYQTQRVHTPIAVIGLGCWYPGAGNPLELWENILSKRVQFRRIPEVRLPLADYYDADKKAADKTYGKKAAVIDGFHFDWRKHRIPKQTYESTDLAHWLALEVSLQALADTGYSMEEIPRDRTGVVVGNTLTGEITRSNMMRLRWPFVNRVLQMASIQSGLSSREAGRLSNLMEQYYKSVFPPENEDSLAGGLSNTIAGRICNYNDFHGCGYTVDGACSSSLIAIATAAAALENGELDLAIAGGVDISLDTFELIGFAKTGALTADQMRVYDRRASGFIPGEGAGFVVLKRLEEAKQEANYTYAVLQGWGISSDGKGGITAPKDTGQAKALERAYAGAPYSIRDVDFFEGHGTGTTLGDRTELKGIARALGAQEKPLSKSYGVTSFKSLAGHTKAAAGVGGFIKSVMAVNRRVIPPMAGCSQPNPVFQEEAAGLFPIRHGEVKARQTTLRAGISAMGFGGSNCHVTIESADPPSDKFAPAQQERRLIHSDQDSELFVFGENSVEELISRIRQIRTVARDISQAELADLAFQLSSSLKGQALFRGAVVADGAEELVGALEFLEKQLLDSPPEINRFYMSPRKDVWFGHNVANKRIGFLFPGQGAQRLHMARMLIERFPWAEKLLLQTEKLTKDSVPDLRRFFLTEDSVLDHKTVTSLAAELANTEIAQPALCLAELVWVKFLQKLGIKPSCVGGHSLGELTAAYAAGSFSEQKLLELAALRGKAMAAPPQEAGGMASLACTPQSAVELLENAPGYVVISNLNSPKQVVISGAKEAVAAVCQKAEKKKIQSRLLAVSNAFHSQFVEGASDKILLETPLAEEFSFQEISFYSGVTGERLENHTNLNQYFARQIKEPVLFLPMVNAMKKECDLFLEIGPGRILSNLITDIDPDLICLPLESKTEQWLDLNTALAALYTLGHDLNGKILYQNRKIKPFRSAEEMSFIENPCERPLDTTGYQKAVREDNGSLEIWLSLLDLDQKDLSAYLDKRKDFLTTLIKADMESLGSLPPAPLRDSERKKPPASKKESAKRTEPQFQDIPEVLFYLAEEKTGFPRASLSLKHKLLDDLNLDSIKASEFISLAAKQMHLAGKLDPSTLANASLEEIAVVLSQQGGKLPQAVPPEPTPFTPPMELVLALAEEKTGFPQNSLSLNNRLLDDLNMDSIKAAEFVGEAAKRLDLAGKLDPTTLANASLEQIAGALTRQREEQRFSFTEPRKVPDSEELLLKLAEEKTGFPRESLSLDHHLLDDLNLDSIKAAEFVGEAAKRYQVRGELDPSSLANASLEQIHQALLGRREGDQQERGPYPSGESEPAVAPSMPESSGQAPRSQGTPWVRSFITRYEKEEIFQGKNPQQGKAAIKGASLCFIGCTGDLDWIEQLKQQFFPLCKTAELYAYADMDQIPTDTYTHYFYISPREDKNSPGIPQLVGCMQRMAKLTAQAGTAWRASTFIFVQFGGGSFGTQGAVNPQSSSYAAFASSLHLEQPRLKLLILDLDPSIRQTDLTTLFIRELSSSTLFSMAGYDHALVRRVPHQILLKEQEFKPSKLSWNKKDVVLVTGGAKGITAQCALALAKQKQCRFALLGRTSLPQKGAENLTRGQKELIQALEKYKELSLESRYFSCDMADPKAVKGIVKQIEEQLGPVTAVIHGAALNLPRRASIPSGEEALEEISPKVLGILHLLEALAQNQLKLIVGFSSIIGVIGMQGNAWYGFSNEIADRILRRFASENPQTKVVTLAYSVWGKIGMGARMGSVAALARMGVEAIPPEAGIEYFLKLIDFDAPDQQVIISSRAWGLDTWNPKSWQVNKTHRYMEEVLDFEPGVEARVKSLLSHKKDPYLKDHCFRGSYLFPTVFGLEAMAQTAFFLGGYPAAGYIRWEDIQLRFPITVPENGETEIHIEALALGSQGKETRVRVGIKTETSGFARYHFEAVCVMGAGKQALGNKVLKMPGALDIQPQEDLYGKTLFQGALFQRIRGIHELTEVKCLFTTELKSDTPTPHTFILGDPYYRDSLLQSGQLFTPDRACLPISVQSWEILPQTKAALVQAETFLLSRTSEQTLNQVNALAPQGEIIEKIQGYKLQFLDKEGSGQTVADLVSPEKWDQGLLHEKLKEAQKLFGNTVPVIALDYRAGMHETRREERHQVESELFQKLWQKNMEGNPPRLSWMESNKPLLKDLENKAVSFSHDSRLLMCSYGDDPQGCDVEIITHKDQQKWEEILGTARKPLLEELLARIGSVDLSVMHIWSALESLRKATNMKESSLSFQKADKEFVIFESGPYTILTFPLLLSRGAERMFAFCVSSHRPSQAVPTLKAAVGQAAASSHPLEIQKTGPRGEAVFHYRFPLTFKENANLGRGVYFTNYFFWVGKVRELMLEPVARKLALQFMSGEWGMVTNYSKTTIFAEVDHFEPIDVLFWIDKVHGSKNSTLDMIFDWRKVRPDGSVTRIALSKQQTTWFKTISHGVVEPYPFPDYFSAFLKDIIPQQQPDQGSNELARLNLDLGKTVEKREIGPGSSAFLLEESFTTSLANSNLVGNNYFGNYFIWQGHLRDRLFHAVDPDHFRSHGEKGELLCLESDVHHLRESMPFDSILVAVALNTLYECGADLYFEYFRATDKGEPQKIALGHHLLAWGKRDQAGAILPLPFPPAMREGLLKLKVLGGR